MIRWGKRCVSGGQSHQSTRGCDRAREALRRTTPSGPRSALCRDPGWRSDYITSCARSRCPTYSKTMARLRQQGAHGPSPCARPSPSSRATRARARRTVPKTRAAHRTNSCFLELHWKTPSSLCEDSLRYKLELRHILNGSTEWSELHRTACSHSHDDSYMYGSRLELPRVLNAAA